MGGRFFWLGAGRAEGGGRGGTLTSPGFGPIRCGRFGVKNARVVKKVGEKETPLDEKETPLGEKVTKVGEKVNFVGKIKIHRVEPADVHLVQMPVRLQPRDRRIVRPQIKIRPAALRSRLPAAQQLVRNTHSECTTARSSRTCAEEFRSAAVNLRLSYTTECCRPSSSGCVRIAATEMLLAFVVSTARRAGSKVWSTGAEERASFSASKLACAPLVHIKRAVGLPSIVSGAASSE